MDDTVMTISGQQPGRLRPDHRRHNIQLQSRVLPVGVGSESASAAAHQIRRALNRAASLAGRAV
jgi:hypothetical protein